MNKGKYCPLNQSKVIRLRTLAPAMLVDSLAEPEANRQELGLGLLFLPIAHDERAGMHTAQPAML
jgi:hypothetical protein